MTDERNKFKQCSVTQSYIIVTIEVTMRDSRDYVSPSGPTVALPVTVALLYLCLRHYTAKNCKGSESPRNSTVRFQNHSSNVLICHVTRLNILRVNWTSESTLG